MSKKYKAVINIVNKLNIPIIDIHKDLLENYADPLSLFPFRTNAHYNELGYRLISEAMVKRITSY